MRQPCLKSVPCFQDKPVLKVCLFGSYVHGHARDIDMLVEPNHEQIKSLLFVQKRLDLDAQHKKMLNWSLPMD